MNIVKKKIKLKFINHLQQSGNKKTYEIILLKSLKNLQKKSIKSYKKIIKINIINSVSIFRIFKLKQKKRKKKKVKEIPLFILDNFERISWSLKTIYQNSKKQYEKKLYKKLVKKILVNSKIQKNFIDKTSNLYDIISQKKRFLLYFRW